MRLLDLVSSWDTRALSRIVITTGPGSSEVTGTFAAFSGERPLAKYRDSDPDRVTPVGPAQVTGLEPLRGPGESAQVVMRARVRAPDASGRIESVRLLEQIDELGTSGIVGTPHLEQLGGGRKLVISTHAGTQEERNDWLRSLARGDI